MSCEKCAPFGGLWRETDQGLRRCDCAEGVRLSAPLAQHAPTISSKSTTLFVEMLAAIPFFPPDGGARTAIGDELRAMCANDERAVWLVTRMRRLYRKWPGVIEMRHVYAAAFPPWDGVHPIGISEHYPEGIPSERQSAPQLAAPAVKLLEGGQKHEEMADPGAQRAIAKLAARMPRMPAGRPIHDRRAQSFAEAVTAPQDRPELPGPTPQIITQADVDRAVLEKRAKETSGEPR